MGELFGARFLDAVLGDEGEVVMLVEDIFLDDPGVLRK